MALTLVLGGARSGKSGYAQHQAETLAAGGARRLVMIVTAQGLDDEMIERIDRHRAARDDRWRVVEAPLDLVGALAALAPSDVAVVDCLTLWLSNQLAEDADIAAATSALLAATASSAATVLFVSNEVGWGIVPDNPLARRFRDEAGRLHQRLAEVCGDVVLVAAGLPLVLKGASRR